MTKPLTKPLTKPVIKPVTIFDKNTKNGQCVVEAVVSVSVTVSAESIGQLEFRFRYRTETKIEVSVVHYIPLLGDLGMMPFSVCDTCFLLALERLEGKKKQNK